jgi:uncharacterized membrane protein
MPDNQRYEREEGEAEALDRHWHEILQELRLAQTGTQIMFAFLLTIGFTTPFQASDDFTYALYAATLVTTAIAMGLFLAPVAFHRVVFQERLRDRMVPIADRLASVGLLFLVAAIAGALLLALDVVMGRGAAIAVVLGVVTITVLLWYALPAWVRQTT